MDRLPSFRHSLGRLALPGTLALLVACGAGSLSADVRLPALFSDHVVLQRDVPVTIWGWAADNEEVTVAFGDQSHTVRAEGGSWSVTLDPLGASAVGRTLTVSGTNTLQVQDVVVGEVWIASGQSNMQWSMAQSDGTADDIAEANSATLRLFYVPRVRRDDPASDVDANWTYSNPETVRNFSAVAWYFGRELERALEVPIGVIHTSWGGSPAEVWMSADVLGANDRYRSEIVDAHAQQVAEYERDRELYEKEQREAEQSGVAFDKRPPRGPTWKPSELYNGMIAPLIPFAIKGAIWYQGESNAGRAHQYRTLFPDLIRNWRRDWGQGEFPFLFVQLAPYDKNRNRPIEEITRDPVQSDWAELREAQSHTVTVLENTGMAVITDLGDKDDIHPRRKQPVGERLARAALSIAYDRGDVIGSGPVFESVTFEDGRAVLAFGHLADGLVKHGEVLTGFAVAGEDRKFVWANARISGDTVVVSSPQVSQPVAVRFGWADYPVVNLFNSAGLPASPFRTDDWPGVTWPTE